MRTIRDASLTHQLLVHIAVRIPHVSVSIIATSDEPTMNQEPRGRFALEILEKLGRSKSQPLVTIPCHNHSHR